MCLKFLELSAPFKLFELIIRRSVGTNNFIMQWAVVLDGYKPCVIVRTKLFQHFKVFSNIDLIYVKKSDLRQNTGNREFSP